MTFDRRRFLTATMGAAALAATSRVADAAPQGIDAAQFGLRPGAPDDQTQRLQRALEQTARNRAPLFLAPGVYRVGEIKLPAGAQLTGVRGQTRLVLTRGTALLSCNEGDAVVLSGLALEGGGQKLPERRGLISLSRVRGLRIVDCSVNGAGGNGVALDGCDGEFLRNTITASDDNALFSLDGKLNVVGNRFTKAGNGAIRIWQSAKRYDGSVIADNFIENVEARAGGNGQNGNGVNIYRGANVVVRNNTIRGMAFSAVRGNAADNLQVIGNICSDCDEMAMWAEFGYVNVLFSANTIDRAEDGIAVTNFNEGGRLGTVINNVIRNLGPRRPGIAPEKAGCGIHAEADVTVTGNTIENAPTCGVRAGWGPYLKNVKVINNTIRNAGVGVAISVAKGAGSATVAGNVIAGARLAVAGMEWDKIATGDLAKTGAAAYPQLSIGTNEIR